MQMKLLHLELSLFSYSSEHERLKLFFPAFCLPFLFRLFAQLYPQSTSLGSGQDGRGCWDLQPQLWSPESPEQR